MSECTHDCSSCSSNCSGAQPQSLIASPHKGSSIKKVIGVVSGKGGVGKSMVTDLLAVAFSRKGYHCAIMDADITGPSMIVGKAVKMAEMMDVPVLGIVENMSYVECPDCGKKISIFGESHVKEVADKYDLLVLSQLPINPSLTAAVDAGKVEDLEFSYMDDAVKIIENTEQKA